MIYCIWYTLLQGSKSSKRKWMSLCFLSIFSVKFRFALHRLLEKPSHCEPYSIDWLNGLYRRVLFLADGATTLSAHSDSLIKFKNFLRNRRYKIRLEFGTQIAAEKQFSSAQSLPKLFARAIMSPSIYFCQKHFVFTPLLLLMSIFEKFSRPSSNKYFVWNKQIRIYIK